MRHPRWAATAALLVACAGAHAEHFQYAVSLSGTYSMGGTDGCSPPDFNQPTCPQPGTLAAILSFDTPVSGDGSYQVAGMFGDITNFSINLGSMSNETLFGSINVNGGLPDGSVQAFDGSESFTFDAASGRASFVYDYGYHEANGSFQGSMTAVPEPATNSLLLLGLAAFLWRRRTAVFTASLVR